MSSLLAEPTSSQMFLPFVRDEYVREEYVGEDSAQTESAGSLAALPTGRAGSDQVATRNRDVKRSSAVASNRGRMMKPVRMGTVMIQLLKQYGITDEEIAQGLHDYASKHRVAQAS